VRYGSRKRQGAGDRRTELTLMSEMPLKWVCGG
jgi:hypothetical protein